MPAGRNPEGFVVESLSELVSRGTRYGCVYADPPWRFDRSPRGAASHHYPTMPLDEIAALPVGELAAENSHLHLWAPSAFLFDARRVLENWGFTYKGVFVWVKPQMGTGYYWRNAVELMLLGVRGSCTFRDRSIPNWLCADRRAHSEKPEQVRALIERVSPGPYLELFARRAVRGWAVFGNEVRRGLFDADIPTVRE